MNRARGGVDGCGRLDEGGRLECGADVAVAMLMNVEVGSGE